MRLITKFLCIVFFLTKFNLYSQIPSDYQTSVSFKTSDASLQKLFDSAEQKAKLNISDFGKYQVLVEGGGYNNVWLETQPMGGFMYAKRNLGIAKNNICIFMDFQREDGRLPGMISYINESLVPYYGWFQGYCFPMPAYELYFLIGKDKEYLNQLYCSLEKFDNYLWKVRDSDKNGCLETWCVYDTGEDNCTRFGESPNAWPFDYPPTEEKIMRMSEKEMKSYCHKTKFNFTADNFPVPIESMDIMSYSYSGREVLSYISKELNNGKEYFWREKANEVRQKIKAYLWDKNRHACYDKDKSNKTMDILLHNNLRCMYYRSFDQQMADEFIKYHLFNPNEFWTPMPLPSIAVNDPFFRNNPQNDWSGQPEALTYQRSIRALENYGHYAELTIIGKKFIQVTSNTLKFTQQIDPFTACVSTTSQQDGYGPSILASLEFISRMYGVNLTRDKVYWSCLDDDNDYSYSQQWGGRLFKLATDGDNVVCSINNEKVFSFSKGMRLVSDLEGNVTEVVGIGINEKDATVCYKGRTYSLSVQPNSVYHIQNDRFNKTSEIPFYRPKENRTKSSK